MPLYNEVYCHESTLKCFRKKIPIGIKSSVYGTEVYIHYSLYFSVYLKSCYNSKLKTSHGPRRTYWNCLFVSLKYFILYLWDKSQKSQNLHTRRILRIFHMFRNWWPQNCIDLPNMTKQVICRNNSSLNMSFSLDEQYFLEDKFTPN